MTRETLIWRCVLCGCLTALLIVLAVQVRHYMLTDRICDAVGALECSVRIEIEKGGWK